MQKCYGILLTAILIGPALAAGARSVHSEEGRAGALVPSQRTSVVSEPDGENASEPLLVTSLDGKITAIDQQSGETLWTFETESPLVSARDSSSYAFSIIPGIQGELYTQQRGLGGGFQQLTQTLPQWVEQTPALMADGSLWLGSRHTHAFFIDVRTGKLIKSYVEYGDGPQSDGPNITELPSGARPVLIGRVDYTVRALHQETGEELFNVSYSRLVRLESETQLQRGEEGPPLGGVEDLGRLGIGVHPEHKNVLIRTEPGSGRQLWSVGFQEPPIAIFAKGETGVLLHDHVALPTRDGGKERPLPQSIVVDRIGSSLYALPVADDAVRISRPAALLPAMDAQYLPHGADGHGSPEEEGLGASMSLAGTPLGLHPLQDTPSPLTSRASKLTNESLDEDAAKIAAGGFGIMSLSLLTGAGSICIFIFAKITEKPRVIASMKEHDKEDIRTLTLSYTGTTQDAAEARAHSKAMLDENRASGKAPESQIRDWTGSGFEHKPGDPPPSTPPQADQSGSEGAEASPFGASEAQEQHSGSEESDVDGNRSSTDSPKSGSKKRKKRKSGSRADKEHGAKRASGVAPDADSDGEGTAEDDRESKVEVGESRDAERSRSQQNDEPSTSGRDLLEATGLTPMTGREPPFGRRSEWKDGVRFIGRLEIGPGIVGYGSSGTLVFEGSLDGRRVAVKRVLRQFYELARKEIGALIVADEHPNIVRCFAMEEDVEFVYLALERCKQSLNDLLGGSSPSGRELFLSSEGEVTDFCMRVCEEAGRGLLALHERGIVHRDLKPHNVLLTEGNRTKLSDMGLCKRLTTDQTSYDSAGPGGSTGWQAPEQLILRAGGDIRQGRSVDIFTFGLLLYYCMTGGRHAFGEAYERDYRILNGRADLEAVAQYPDALSLIRAMLRPQAKQRPSIASVMAHPFWWPAAKRLAFLIDVSNRVENEDREVDRTLLKALESFSEHAIGDRDWASKLDPQLLANLGRYRKYNPGSLRDLLRVIRNKHNHFREMPEDLQNKLGPLPKGFLRYFTSRFPSLLLAAYTFALENCSEEPTFQQYFPTPAKEFPFATANMSLKVKQPEDLRTGASMLENNGDRTNSAPGPITRAPPLASEDELREATQRSKSESALLPPPPMGPNVRGPVHQNAQKHRGWWSSSDSEDRSEAASDAPSAAERSGSGDSGRSGGEGRAPPSSSGFLDPAAFGQAGDRHSPPRGSYNSGSSHSSSPSLPPPHPPFEAAPTPPMPMAPPHMVPMPFSSMPRPFPGVGPPPMGGGTPPLAHPGAMPFPGYGVPDASGVLLVGDALKVTVLPPGVRQLRDRDGYVNVFPQRLDHGAPQCDFYLKTGHCKFGETCRFHHPISAAVKLTAEGGFPMRPGNPVCPFYDRTGVCKYAASCKFHHPAKPGQRDRSSEGGRASTGSHPSSSGSLPPHTARQSP